MGMIIAPAIYIIQQNLFQAHYISVYVLDARGAP